MHEFLKTVPGAQNLFEFFGCWPSFHDAEVLSVELHRTGPSKVRAHTWAMTDKVDADGHYVCEKHCVVTFSLEDLTKVEVLHFNDQNALSDLEFYRDNDEFVLSFHPGHGLQGSIRAKHIDIEFQPGIPPDSQYKENEV
jgi:hypothetical protein